MESLKKSFKEKEEVIKRQRKSVEYLETRTTHLASLHFLITAMVMLTVSQPSEVVHGFRWILFCFSLLVTLFTVPTISSTISRWGRTQHHYESSIKTQNKINQQILLLQHQIKLSVDPQIESPETTYGADKIGHLLPLKPNKWRAYNAFVVLNLLASTALVFQTCRSTPKTHSPQS